VSPASSTWKKKKYPDGSQNLLHLLIVACCLVPGLDVFLHNNDKMAEVNLLMTTLLNFATQNSVLFPQGWRFNGQVGGGTKLMESNNVKDGNH